MHHRATGVAHGHGGLQRAGRGVRVGQPLVLALLADFRLPSCFTRLVVALSLGAARVLVSAAPAMAGALAPAMHTDESTLGSEWPFETDFNDHFETPRRAFRDVRPALRAIAKGRDVEPAALRIYDPYYCRGEACFGGACGCGARAGVKHATHAPR